MGWPPQPREHGRPRASVHTSTWTGVRERLAPPSRPLTCRGAASLGCGQPVPCLAPRCHGHTHLTPTLPTPVPRPPLGAECSSSCHLAEAGKMLGAGGWMAKNPPLEMEPYVRWGVKPSACSVAQRTSFIKHIQRYNYEEFLEANQQRQSIKPQVWDPSECRVLWDCIGCPPKGQSGCPVRLAGRQGWETSPEAAWWGAGTHSNPLSGEEGHY